MFGKKPKPQPNDPRKRKGAELMNQMGFGMPANMEDMENMVYGDDDDDLEAELAALTVEDADPRKASPTKKAPVHMSAIEQMAAESMKDLDDEDLSDTEDPDLLAELADLHRDDEAGPFSTPAAPPPTQSPPMFAATTSHSPAPEPSKGPTPTSLAVGGDVVAVVQDRITMYQQAFDRAKATGDMSKQRRLDRGLKTLTDTLKKAKAGKPVTEDDIPPPVAVGASAANGPSSAASTPSPVHTSPEPARSPAAQNRIPAADLPGPSYTVPNTSTLSPDTHTQRMLEARRDQYRHAALDAKKGGDIPTASKYVKIAKQFDAVIQALEEGNPVDLSKMPPPPPEVAGPSAESKRLPSPEVKIQRSAVQGAGGTEGASEEAEVPPEPTEEEAKRLFQAPDAPKTVMEALIQRLEKYKCTESGAKVAGESSKARRMGRIVKQYEDAIKMYRAGKPVDFEELPTPPGFGPIPVDTGPPPPGTAAPTPSPSQPASTTGAAGCSSAPTPALKPQMVSPPKPAPSTGSIAAVKVPSALSSSSGTSVDSKHSISRTAGSRKSGYSRQEQQLAFLRERMEEFKTAALQAKKNKDLELAKHHIRMMKGLEPMVEALESGLPVDLSQVPPSPLANEDNEDKFVVVSAEDCTPTGDRDEVFTQLEQDLVTQMRTCATNAQHFTKLGDVLAAAKFQKLEQSCRKDLESLKSAKRHGDPVPKFHYETRSFSVVQCNTDLGEAEMEVTVIRGISYNLPSGFSEKDMDTVVKYEFGFPTEEPQTGHTQTVKETINPEYNDSFKLQINRKSRGFARYIERKGIKLDVFIKRGFFKGDKLLGSANVKLTPLESKCTLHDSFDLSEGRKSVGGKLEVKVRVRDPFKGRQVEESKEKWLVIDQFIRTLGSKSQAAPAAVQKDKNEGTTCMEVLRFEKQQLDKQISYLKDSLTAIQMQTLRHKSALLEEKLELQQKQLREGGSQAWIAYIGVVEKEMAAFELEARQLTRIGDVQKAELMMNKCKLAKKELTAIKAKFPSSS